jgi:hypothetical protein
MHYNYSDKKATTIASIITETAEPTTTTTTIETSINVTTKAITTINETCKNCNSNSCSKMTPTAIIIAAILTTKNSNCSNYNNCNDSYKYNNINKCDRGSNKNNNTITT